VNGRVEADVGIDLYWLPLGTGGLVIRPVGIAFEALAARVASRSRLDLYHAALDVRTPGARFVVEAMPSVFGRAARAGGGVIADGPMAVSHTQRLRLLRYELRCWRDGTIADADLAVESPLRVSDDAQAAVRLLELASSVPMCTWGRDELGAGEMWTSNSVVAWLVARARAANGEVQPPAGGRAPGWSAGLRIAARDATGRERRGRARRWAMRARTALRLRRAESRAPSSASARSDAPPSPQQGPARPKGGRGSHRRSPAVVRAYRSPRAKAKAHAAGRAVVCGA